jgi:hypothetical protein
VKDEPTPPKSIDQADMEGKDDNIIRVTNIRGATINVSISEINKCTWDNKIGEKVLSRGL